MKFYLAVLAIAVGVVYIGTQRTYEDKAIKHKYRSVRVSSIK